jgi:hypothetical protein
MYVREGNHFRRLDIMRNDKEKYLMIYIFHASHTGVLNIF